MSVGSYNFKVDSFLFAEPNTPAIGQEISNNSGAPVTAKTWCAQYVEQDLNKR